MYKQESSEIIEFSLIYLIFSKVGFVAAAAKVSKQGILFLYQEALIQTFHTRLFTTK